MNRETRAELTLYLVAFAFAVLGWAFTGPRDAAWEPPAREPTTLRVMTWNVGGATGLSGTPLDEDLVGHVAAVIAGLDPDLVCVQELHGPGQLGRLVEKLRVPDADWSARIGWRGDRRVALLARRGSLRARSRATAGDRDFLLGWWIDESGSPVAVAAIHADAYSAERRNLSIGRAADALAAMAGEAAGLLLGDLNIDVDPDKRQELFTANEARDIETYNYVAGRLEDVARGTGSTAQPDRRLDYVFATPGAFTVRGAGPVRGRRAGDMDHDPVVVDLVRTGNDTPRLPR